MPQDLTSKRKDMASLAVALAKKAQDIAIEVAEWRTFYTDNGFNVGAANQFVDSDFSGTEIGHITAAILEQFYVDIANIALTAPQKSTMRKIAKTPIT